MKGMQRFTHRSAKTRFVTLKPPKNRTGLAASGSNCNIFPMSASIPPFISISCQSIKTGRPVSCSAVRNVGIVAVTVAAASFDVGKMIDDADDLAGVIV
jgi:hypothetical protein